MRKFVYIKKNEKELQSVINKIPYYSFIMPCFNNWNLTKQAVSTLIDSISQDHKEKGIELIIVNDGSSDETMDGLIKLKEQFDKEIEIIIINRTENLGYNISINQGLANSRGQITTIINNDLIFPNNWFDGIVETLESDNSVGAAVPFLSYASGPASVGVGFSSITELEIFSKQFMMENRNKIIYIERVIGACISIKKELLSLIGGNDFWFGLGFFEDDDWSLRACIAGYKLAIVGASFVQHMGSQTMHLHSKAAGAAIESSGRKFARKWNIIHDNRKEIVGRNTFNKDEYFFPIKIDEYHTSNIIKNEKLSNKSIIMVADWQNDLSKWKEKLLEVKNEFLQNNDYQIYFWIPKKYFSHEYVVNEIEKTIGGNFSSIHYIFDDIYPIDVLMSLSQYEKFVGIEGDYVNLFLKKLIENISIEII
jgi:O-antigen biosynthesis protein